MIGLLPEKNECLCMQLQLLQGSKEVLKIIVGLDAFSNQRLLYLAPFRVYVFLSTTLLKDVKLQ